MSRARRGVALVAALLLAATLLMLGYAMLASRSGAYSESPLQLNAVQADLLAQMGMDATLVKLSKDVGFPPRMGGRTVFSCGETVTDGESGRRIGTWTVTVDLTHRAAPLDSDPAAAATYAYPAFTVRLRSVGRVLGGNDQVLASRRIDAELDVSPQPRGATPDLSRPFSNPGLFRFIRWENGGAP